MSCFNIFVQAFDEAFSLLFRVAFMKVLVVGGTGFIGTRLVRALCGAGHQVRILSRKDPVMLEFDKEAVEFVRVDLLDLGFKLDKVVVGCSVVFNCAGELYNEKLMGPLHIDATLRLVHACRSVAKATGKTVHWVQLSSVGAYGPSVAKPSAERIVTEETATEPVGAYETTKTKADELVISAAEEGAFSYSILRPSNVYGAGMPNDSLRQWANVIRRKLFFYVGAPGAIATYVHVDDVVDALILCGCDSRAKGEVFNISNDCPQECLVEAIAEVLNVSAPKLRVPEGWVRLISNVFSGMKNFPVSRSRIDALVSRTHYPTDKLETVLGYRPRRNTRVSISEVFR